MPKGKFKRKRLGRSDYLLEKAKRIQKAIWKLQDKQDEIFTYFMWKSKQ